MPLHEWTRVYPGTFHDFHCSWIIHLKEALNGGLLPDDFYALAEHQQFVDKVAAALQHGIHLLVIDFFPPGPWDPQGIHGAIWERVGGGTFELPADKPLTLAAYRSDRIPEAFVEPICAGQVLLDMPLFLSTDWYIPAPLEPTYREAYQGEPSYVRDLLEGRAPPEDEPS